VAEALIAECAGLCRERGAVELTWQTAKDNLRAQALYERLGVRREEWLDYSLTVPANESNRRRSSPIEPRSCSTRKGLQSENA